MPEEWWRSVIMKMSIALATYNGVRYLPELLESLAAQGQTPCEVVVGDDRSEDNTVALVNRFASKVPFPVYLRVNPVRLGYADNFLSLARACQGDVVCFCDQDDVWHPNKLGVIGGAFDGCPGAVLVAHHAAVVDASGASLGRRFPRGQHGGLYPPPVVPLQAFPGFSIAVRRPVLSAASPAARPRDADPRVGLLGHDAWLWLLAACVGDVAVLPDELVFYRQHVNLFGDLQVSRRVKLARAASAGQATYGLRSQYLFTLMTYLEGLARVWRVEGQDLWSQNALSLAARYRRLAEAFDARGDLYSSRSRIRAIHRYSRLMRSGAYRILEAEGFASRHAFSKDLVFLMFRSLPIP
jgi:glycosyltransferase involved in cell wall biosynthesis